MAGPGFEQKFPEFQNPYSVITINTTFLLLKDRFCDVYMILSFCTLLTEAQINELENCSIISIGNWIEIKISNLVADSSLLSMA